MLSTSVIESIADELVQAHDSRAVVSRLTARYSEMTVADSYAVQAEWGRRRSAAGHQVVGHKIGLTSKVMQVATGIDEPDYGVIFADQSYSSGAEIPFDAFSNVRIETELAFVLKSPLEGPDVSVDDVLAATDYVTPAIEVLNSHIQLEGRTIVDTIADNAALGAIVSGGNRIDPAEVDLYWISAVLSRNDTIEESGVAAAILGNPPLGVAWLARTLAQHGAGLAAGEIILAGSFTRPMWVERGDLIRADFGIHGEVTCRFI